MFPDFKVALAVNGSAAAESHLDVSGGKQDRLSGGVGGESSALLNEAASDSNMSDSSLNGEDMKGSSGAANGNSKIKFIRLNNIPFSEIPPDILDNLNKQRQLKKNVTITTTKNIFTGKKASNSSLIHSKISKFKTLSSTSSDIDTASTMTNDDEPSDSDTLDLNNDYSYLNNSNNLSTLNGSLNASKNYSSTNSTNANASSNPSSKLSSLILNVCSEKTNTKNISTQLIATNANNSTQPNNLIKVNNTNASNSFINKINDKDLKKDKNTFVCNNQAFSNTTIVSNNSINDFAIASQQFQPLSNNHSTLFPQQTIYLLPQEQAQAQNFVILNTPQSHTVQQNVVQNVVQNQMANANLFLKPIIFNPPQQTFYFVPTNLNDANSSASKTSQLLQPNTASPILKNRLGTSNDTTYCSNDTFNLTNFTQQPSQPVLSYNLNESNELIDSNVRIQTELVRQPNFHDYYSFDKFILHESYNNSYLNDLDKIIKLHYDQTNVDYKKNLKRTNEDDCLSNKRISSF
jgi:hypothetical protein